MIKLAWSRRGRHNPPRRTILDRLTPGRLRVWYSPDPDVPGYLWSCNRCARRHTSPGLGGGLTRTLAEARHRAKRHARKHFGMRAVYEVNCDARLSYEG